MVTSVSNGGSGSKAICRRDFGFLVVFAKGEGTPITVKHFAYGEHEQYIHDWVVSVDYIWYYLSVSATAMMYLPYYT